MQLKRRLQNLERQQNAIALKPLRFVVSCIGKPLDLSKATCRRTRLPNGQLMELVHLKGNRSGLSEEDLERFIQSFPIEPSRR